jgi:hypothetical protein
MVVYRTIVKLDNATYTLFVLKALCFSLTVPNKQSPFLVDSAQLVVLLCDVSLISYILNYRKLINEKIK